MNSIVLIRLKQKAENSVRSQDDFMQEDIEEVKSDQSVTGNSSILEDEDAERETPRFNTKVFDPEVVNHHKRAKRAKRMNSKEAKTALKHLSQEDKQILQEKVQRAQEIQCEFIRGLKESA